MLEQPVRYNGVNLTSDDLKRLAVVLELGKSGGLLGLHKSVSGAEVSKKSGTGFDIHGSGSLDRLKATGLIRVVEENRQLTFYIKSGKQAALERLLTQNKKLWEPPPKPPLRIRTPEQIQLEREAYQRKVQEQRENSLEYKTEQLQDQIIRSLPNALAGRGPLKVLNAELTLDESSLLSGRALFNLGDSNYTYTFKGLDFRDAGGHGGYEHWLSKKGSSFAIYFKVNAQPRKHSNPNRSGHRWTNRNGKLNYTNGDVKFEYLPNRPDWEAMWNLFEAFRIELFEQAVPSAQAKARAEQDAAAAARMEELKRSLDNPLG